MLEDLRGIFKSRLKSLEVLYLLEDIKPCARIMVREEEKEIIPDFLRKNGIYCELSDFKVVKQDSERAYSAYSDKGIKVPLNSNEKGYFFVYISKERGLAEKAKELEKEDKHRELGMLLGYPKCCSEFFERYFNEYFKNEGDNEGNKVKGFSNDLTLFTLKESDGFDFPFYTNIASRHFDWALLSHFPCSFSCSHSIELAKRHLEALEKDDYLAAERMRNLLRGAVVYTESKGVFLLQHSHLENKMGKNREENRGNIIIGRLYYKGVIGPKNTPLYNLLANAKHLEVLKKDRLIIDNFEFRNVGIMLFF